MAIDPVSYRSRRTVLAGLGGAVAALVTHAVARPLPVRAEGESMTVGGDHFTATSATQLKNTQTDNDVFIATSTRGRPRRLRQERP